MRIRRSGARTLVAAAVLGVLSPAACLSWPTASPVAAAALPDSNEPDPTEPTTTGDADCCGESPGEVSPGEVSPGEVSPGEVSPGEVSPGEPSDQKPAPTISVDPPRTVAGSTVLLTGGCGGPFERAQLDTPEGWRLAAAAQAAGQGSASGSARLQVPDDASGVFTMTLTCDGVSASDDLEVLAAPDLRIEPAMGPPGTQGVATGTCLGSYRGSEVDVFLDDGKQLVGNGVLTEPGIFVATVTVPEGTGLGPHRVSTSCGGRSAFTVVPVTTPPSTAPGGVGPPGSGPPGGGPHGQTEPPGEESPGEESVAVPDLQGLTEADASAELEDRGLRLANPSGAEGTVAQQDPLPGTEVPVGTPVALVLTALVDPVPEASSRSLFPVFVGGGLAVLAVGAAAAPLLHLRRRLRERRWVDQQVAIGIGELTPAHPAPTAPTAPGFEVRFELRRDPARGPREVAHGDR